MTIYKSATAHERYKELIALAQKQTPIKVAVAHPCDDVSLRGALEARRLGLIEPILVGPTGRIKAVAEKANLDLDDVELLNADYSEASAAAAVELVTKGRVEGPDERELAYRRTHGRNRIPALRNPDEPADQPLLHHGCAGPP